MLKPRNILEKCHIIEFFPGIYDQNEYDYLICYTWGEEWEVYKQHVDEDRRRYEFLTRSRDQDNALQVTLTYMLSEAEALGWGISELEKEMNYRWKEMYQRNKEDFYHRYPWFRSWVRKDAKEEIKSDWPEAPQAEAVIDHIKEIKANYSFDGSDWTRGSLPEEKSEGTTPSKE